MIHSSAVIDPRAEIGPDCHIGPFCTIGPDVRLGRGCALHSHVVIDGLTTLGEGNEIFPFVSIGLKSQDLKWKGGQTHTRIGDRNTFREGVTIHSATGDGETTRVGSHNHILAYCHLAHNVEMGDHNIMSNYSGAAGHVIIEDHVVVAAMSGIHQFCRIGRLSMIGGCSKVVQDVPPFMIVDGNPAVTRTVNKIGLERNGIPSGTQQELRRACKILFREGLSMSNALERVERELQSLPELQHLVRFARASERGVC